MDLRIAHLYPQYLNLYGDRGNLLALVRRCQWRGLGVSLTEVSVGDPLDPEFFDLYFIGGGQDSQQAQIGDDLFTHKAPLLKAAVANQGVFLTICGGYQLLGHYYKPFDGDKVPGLGLMDAYTEAGRTRMIGNVAIERQDAQGNTYTIVGFENHSGKTFLGEGVQPLGRVVEGFGNNGEDGFEGAVSGNLWGTYLHGPLLPKNPELADELILKALSRRYGTLQGLPPLLGDAADMTLERGAHQKAMSLCRWDAQNRKEHPLKKFIHSLQAYR